MISRPMCATRVRRSRRWCENAGVAQPNGLRYALTDHRHPANISGQCDLTDGGNIERQRGIVGGGSDCQACRQVSTRIDKSDSSHGCHEHVFVCELQAGYPLGDGNEHGNPRRVQTGHSAAWVRIGGGGDEGLHLRQHGPAAFDGDGDARAGDG